MKGFAKKNQVNGNVEVKSAIWHFATKILPIVWIIILVFTALGKWTFGLQDMYKQTKEVPKLAVKVLKLEQFDIAVKSQLEGMGKNIDRILNLLLEKSQRR